MRKSILMGTREDVIKRRAKQANNAPVHNSNSNRTFDSVRRIVTFNHPCLNNWNPSGFFLFCFSIERNRR